MSRLAVAQAREGRAGVVKSPDEGERGVEVVSVEDRLVDVLEAYPVEASAPRMPAVASASPSEKVSARRRPSTWKPLEG
jgi:hypothetical protein